MSNVAYLFGDSTGVATSLQPRAGNYYQTKKGDTPWAIAKTAYQDQGLAPVKTGLFLLNDNPANSHIRKAKSNWESYKIKGIQLEPKYAPGSVGAPYGSGKSYPILWVPPVDGSGPGGGVSTPGKDGATGPTGARGPQGVPGPRGPQGIPGPPPSAAMVNKLIGDYMLSNPTGGNVTPAQLAQAIAAYMAQHPIAQGARGPVGPQGPQGERGPAGTSADFDMNAARDFVDARIRVLTRDLGNKTGPVVQTAGFNSDSLLAAGIMGGAVVVALAVWKGRRKR